MPNLTIHRTHRQRGAWSAEVPEGSFRRESVDGVDFAVTTRNFYMDGEAGKLRWTDEKDTIHDVYLIKNDQAVYAFSLPHREALSDRLKIVMAEDQRPLFEHVKERFVPGGLFDRIVERSRPAPEPESAPSFAPR